jgi:extracellular factor (EF) 3-hydroxypalmitic acid methyl ester biosynthesis protein
MEFVVDWHLVYRDDSRFSELAPDRAPAEICKLEHDDTGVNVFSEIRKPE